MPKVRYDVKGVDAGTGDVVPAGLYDAVIEECTYGKSSNGNAMFTVVLAIKGGKYDGRKIWNYILPEQAEFRMREFVDALQLPDAGSLDTDAIVGTMLQIKTVVQKSPEYGDQARVKNMLPSAGEAEEGEDVPYSEWETSELSDELTVREITLPGRKTKAAMIKALEADDEANGGDGDEDEEDDDSEDEEEGVTAEEIRVLERADLRALAKENELEVKFLKSKSTEDLAEEVIAALGLEDEDPEEDEEEEEEEEDEEDEDEAVDYSTWEISELKDELKERGLKPDGKKAILVKRLENDDATSEDEPF